ncbi:DMT family transporter [Parabacteroides bouchesdurhonensis]|uniref:DMT family transporter n=1 Tax=Parabacteroides bouchesdurhonensis TaxID=1936995 RepID=UPI000C836EAE|nr:DMT family transporter [Parabacteroides bouchesdurhonensis]RHJ91799.1 DMT family transporter [Bacteroides sp. AM07-16]
MKNKKTEANICMVIAKTFSGLNMNALKYLLPLWISPLTGASLRCVFAAVAFWIIGLFTGRESSTTREKVLLFLLGAVGIYGFMFLYLVGLSKTTPISSSIFSSLQPIWVFVIMVIFYKEKISMMKVIGIAVGLAGALVCILTQKSDDLAADAFNGNMLCLASSVFYAIYLVLSKQILKNVGVMTMLKYTFTGAAFSSLLVLPAYGFEAKLFTDAFQWWPFAVLMFVLIFPTVLTYLLVPVGLKYLSTTLVAIYGYLILIVATVASLLIGQDRFSWTQTIAILFICAGVYFVEIAEGKERKAANVS